MRKVAMANYYNNIDTSLIEGSGRSSKINWKLLNDVFQVKSNVEIPPFQITDELHGNIRFFENETDKS